MSLVHIDYRKWIAFEEQWDKLLAAYGVESLHMKDFTQSRGEFAGWEKNEAKRRMCISQFIYLIEDHYLHSFGSAILREAFRSADKEYRLSEHISQYGHAACNCIAKVRDWAEQNGEDFSKIMFVLEDGDKGKGKMMEMAKAGYGVNAVLWPKTKSKVFQAADILAYEQYRLALKIINRDASTSLVDWRELRAPFKFMADFRGSDRWSYTDERNLRQGCLNASMPIRERGLMDEREASNRGV